MCGPQSLLGGACKHRWEAIRWKTDNSSGAKLKPGISIHLHKGKTPVKIVAPAVRIPILKFFKMNIKIAYG